ncbi:ABC transporter permease [Rhizobium sp. SAFR-030]|jgi:fructose transport system permease protein|uniref:ABC transporter permease n=1 Tax=Rhizobium sp. SAFR-030 TaxID=3387277 RepID=UPI003F7D62AF
MSEPEAASKSHLEYEKVLSGSATHVAQFDTHDKTPLQRFQHFLHSSPAAVPLIVLVLSLAVFGSILGTKFFSAFSLTLILQQVAITGIIGAAQSLIILTAGIDLSVGAIMVLSSVVMGQFAIHYGIPTPLAIVAGFAVGALCGFINGVLVARMKLPPFIVTLGMWQIVLASNFLYSANETIRAQDLEANARLLQFFGQNVRLGGAVLTYGVIAMILLVALLWYVLNHTAWGRHLYAVGDDPEAAELAGVNVKRMLISVYTLSGLICALGGWALIGRIGSVSPTAGQFANIESITAVVIGGLSLFGGRGSILGMLFGALIVGVFALGLRLIGTDPQWTYLMIGVLIIGAVAIDQWIRKVAG